MLHKIKLTPLENSKSRNAIAGNSKFTDNGNKFKNSKSSSSPPKYFPFVIYFSSRNLLRPKSQFFKNPLTIDLRALAFFRIYTGLLVIYDLIFRAFNLETFQGNEGLISATSAAWYGLFSLHYASGSLWFQGFALLLHGLIALLFIAGYKTRFMTFLMWLMWFSLMNRNIYITQSSDDLLALFFMWGIFLPLGARYSIDAALNKYEIKNNEFFSFATIAILTQAMYVYFFGALLKMNYAPWLDGMAVYQIFNWQGYGSPLATEILAKILPLSVMKLMTYMVMGIELIGPVLILLPLKNLTLRMVVLSLMFTMHICFILFMGVGMYPLVSFASLSLFLPAIFWNRLEKKLGSEERQQIKIYYDEDCGFCYKTCLIFRMFCLPQSVPILPAQRSKKYGPILKKYNSWVVVDHTGKYYVKWEAVTFVLSKSPVLWPLAWAFRFDIMAKFGEKLYDKIANNRPAFGNLTRQYLPFHYTTYKISWVSVALLAFLFSANFAENMLDHVKTKYAQSIENFAGHMKLRKWVMFMNMPPQSQSWYDIHGITVNNNQVDAWRLKGEPLYGKRPKNIFHDNANYRMRKYHQGHYYSYAKGDFGRFICKRWNKTFPKDQLKRFIFNLHWENYNYYIRPISSDKRLEFIYNCITNTIE